LPALQQVFEAEHGNPAVGTEIGNQYKATVTWSAAANASLSATASSSRTGTFTQNDALGASFANTNTLTQGVELSARVAVTPRVRLQASYTEQNTIDERPGVRAHVQPTALARLETDIEIARNWSVNARLSYDDGQWARSVLDPFRYQDLPGRTVADLRTTYTIPGRGAKIWLAGENILDADGGGAAGYPASGSRVLLGAAYAF
jgi:outer membrane cobalamin receptor